MISSSTTTKKGFDPVPAGNHVARLYRIIHIGTVVEEYKGEKKDANKVRLGFELPNETKVFKEGDEAKPLVIDREFTLSMHEKANLRKFVEGILGVTFLDEEANIFDIAELMGKTCLLNVVHKKATNGNTYANIQSASPLPKGMTAPAAFNRPILLDYDNWDGEVFNTLPPFIADKIKTSQQYKEKFGDNDENANIPF